MPTLLITNDDGIDSPFLKPMVEQLSALGAVRVAVPAGEQSWKSKAITRHGRLTVQAREELGVPTFAVQGTPADCVNLGLHHLFDGRPDWVISGINIGHNVGAGLVINSGTVGAALEGALCGAPAVAFSTFVTRELYQGWITQRRFEGAQGPEILASTTRRMAGMLRTLLACGLPPGAMLLNINFPGIVDAHTPVRWAPLQDHRYGSLFAREGDGFVHRFAGLLQVQPGGSSDLDVVRGGAISVTALSLAGLSLPPPAEGFEL